MYSDKENINILSALLVAHGVRHAVVCPGSRNAPIVHNLSECPSLTCYPVTDERSAGFYALGMALRTGLPTVVCVTSGSALLNLAPAVAEAFYQRVPLVVVSADRPQQWIDQLDGQTLPQPGAFGRFVAAAVNLPEVPSGDRESHWHCNRLVNEALLAATAHGGAPVHINVPISRPLYNFTRHDLPQERMIVRIPALRTDTTLIMRQMSEARRPLIVVGQMRDGELPRAVTDALAIRHYVVLQEALSAEDGSESLDAMLKAADETEFPLPDFIVYVGRTLVSARLKDYLRRAVDARCWRIDETGAVIDTFMNLTGIVEGHAADVLAAVGGSGPVEWYDRWQQLRTLAGDHRRSYEPAFSTMLAVKRFEERLPTDDAGARVFYANSMAVRMGCIYARHRIGCNRGVNGIEGSLSTAAGYSLLSDGNVYCVIGDLSFFYDRNALWNSRLRGNFRILLFNNGGGGIFEKFSAIADAADALNVKAQYRTTARGFCSDNGIDYLSVADGSHLDEGLRWLTGNASGPRLLEVVSDSSTDWTNYENYFNTL